MPKTQTIVEIARSFDQHAEDYDVNAQVQTEIGKRLLERLDYFKVQPQRILELGCGPGLCLKALKKRYPKAELLGVDLAESMLKLAKSKQGWRQKAHLLKADMHALPFADNQFDLIFSNQVIHWSESIPTLFRELNRILTPGGCILFSTLGPDTFKELRQSFARVDEYQHVNTFQDMHDLGDALMSASFDDPVVDMEMLYAHYPSVEDLLRRLKLQGVKNIHPKRHPGLMGKHMWLQFKENMASFKTASGLYPLTYEIIYGHAWKVPPRPMSSSKETRISVSEWKASDAFIINRSS